MNFDSFLTSRSGNGGVDFTVIFSGVAADAFAPGVAGDAAAGPAEDLGAVGADLGGADDRGRGSGIFTSTVLPPCMR